MLAPRGAGWRRRSPHPRRRPHPVRARGLGADGRVRARGSPRPAGGRADTVNAGVYVLDRAVVAAFHRPRGVHRARDVPGLLETACRSTAGCPATTGSTSAAPPSTARPARPLPGRSHAARARVRPRRARHRAGRPRRPDATVRGPLRDRRGHAGRGGRAGGPENAVLGAGCVVGTGAPGIEGHLPRGTAWWWARARAARLHRGRGRPDGIMPSSGSPRSWRSVASTVIPPARAP
jgi:hypothetical protein